MPYPRREMNVAQRWPDHAGHSIRYSEHGRTDYAVRTVFVIDYEDEDEVEVGDYDNRPVDGDIDMSEFWCVECGEVLR